VLAIKTEKSIGERILAASQTPSFLDFAKILKMAYPKSNVKTGKAPTLLIKFLSNFDGEIKAILPLLGRDMLLSNSKATSILGINFIAGEDSVKNSANYLIKTGVIKL